MTVRPVSRPPAPFTVPANGSIDERFAAIASELNRKQNAGIAGPAFHFYGIISPNGTTYRLTVDDTGALHTEVTPR
jgi:hypothetical protein